MSPRRAPALLSLALLALLGACDSGTTGNVTTSEPTTAAPTTSTSVSPAPTEQMTLAVYYLAEDPRRGPVLAREFRKVAKSTEVVRSAVDAMLHLAPLDPDYSSLWPKSTTVLGVSTEGDLATVDLSKEAAGGSSGAAAEGASFQQLVHTVTAAAPAVKRVQLHVDGKPVESLWGHADTSKPTARAPQVDTLAAVQIDTPNEGDTVGRTVTFSGAATVYEANVVWRISTGCPRDVTCPGTPTVFLQDHTTATAGNGERGTWSVTVTLPDAVFETSGYIEIRAEESSGMEGQRLAADTKVVRAVAG
jgi:hypothetical protein